MAQQQEFHPGLSLAGAVDLESLKHQVKAEPGQAGGAPAAGGYDFTNMGDELFFYRDAGCLAEQFDEFEVFLFT